MALCNLNTIYNLSQITTTTSDEITMFELRYANLETEYNLTFVDLHLEMASVLAEVFNNTIFYNNIYDKIKAFYCHLFPIETSENKKYTFKIKQINICFILCNRTFKSLIRSDI